MREDGQKTRDKVKDNLVKDRVTDWVKEREEEGKRTEEESDEREEI